MILRFTIVQNKFQQTNKNKTNHINDNHIKFEVSLHFGGIWPAVRRQAMRGGCRGAQACDHRFSICKAARQPAFKLFAASIFPLKKYATYFGFRVIHQIVCQKNPF